MAALDQEGLQQNLKKRRVCRFCLSTDQIKLSNIYVENTRIKTSAPLPIQIMAIASIDVFNNDGMPCYVCTDCAAVFEYSYQFKQMCQKADNLLRQYPLTGKWPRTLEQPLLDSEHILQTSPALNIADKQQYHSTPATGLFFKRKRDLANAVPSSDPARPQRLQTKVKQGHEVNNNQNTLDYIQHIVAAADEIAFENRDQPPVEVADSANKAKTKLLNKFSVRMLNKDVGSEKEPNFPKNAEVRKTLLDICQYCDRTFPLMPLDSQSKSHSQDRHCQCKDSKPGLLFFKSKLKRHDAVPFKCTACDTAFSRASSSQRQQQTHNDISKYICKTCKRQFSSKRGMEKHTGLNKTNCRFQCKICNKRFAFKHGLEVHEVIRSRHQGKLERAIKQEQGSRKRKGQSVKPEFNESSDENTRFVPLKQIKYDGDGNKIGGATQLRHNSAKPAAVNLSVRDKKQSSSMQAMLKLSRDYYLRVRNTAKTPDESPKGCATQVRTTVPRQ